jgi:hypothetical protein
VQKYQKPGRLGQKFFFTVSPNICASFVWNFLYFEGGWVRQITTVLGSYDSFFLTDPPTLICIKHNGDEEPKDFLYFTHLVPRLLRKILDLLKISATHAYTRQSSG